MREGGQQRINTWLAYRSNGRSPIEQALASQREGDRRFCDWRSLIKADESELGAGA